MMLSRDMLSNCIPVIALQVRERPSAPKWYLREIESLKGSRGVGYCSCNARHFESCRTRHHSQDRYRSVKAIRGKGRKSQKSGEKAQCVHNYVRRSDALVGRIDIIDKPPVWDRPVKPMDCNKAKFIMLNQSPTMRRGTLL